MISTDFAPNETWSDGISSLKILFQPWKWRRGEALQKAERKLKMYFPEYQLFFYLSGRSGLYNLLKALNLPQGTEILIQAFTCQAVILPILANKLKPVYVDIENQSFSINPIDLEEKISPKSKVLILQHSFGFTPSQRNKILSISKKYNLLLIEDIAHGFDQTIIKQQNKQSIYLLSFGSSKALSSVYGGAISTNDKTIITLLAKQRQSFLKKQPSFLFILRSLFYKPLSLIIKQTYNLYIGKILHFILKTTKLLPFQITSKEKKGEFDNTLNKRYPNALAFLLINQLEKFQRIEKQRKKISEYYLTNLNKKIVNNLLTINNSLIRFPILSNNRHQLIKSLAKKNIFLGNWYNQVIAPKGINLDKIMYEKGSCPQAEKIAQKIVNLPTNITIQQAEKICQLIQKELS